ncbi:hypothetical protein KDU71_21615 [Carboxylicivirga sediminis]|uniref:DUF4177 domain-containing protein n=1 Tax=Carboxylicivirga sediminis TaxID=2006564 RepID=A0A941J0S1_9BACT|nr:hypothetical protein [Carboxylicivirga sediminis]MBR8538184.1 hypothetical protein [Carboxylicivirga sediminis]
MKTNLITTLIVLLVTTASFAQDKPVYEVKIITSIESIVPNGVGRSRLISTDSEVDYKQFTTTQTAESGDRNKSDRSDIRIKDYDETKLLNFFNVGGIRFQNIASNDALLTSKINQMMQDGWELAFVNTGVESYGGKDDNNGIYITRYLFKRLKPATTDTPATPESNEDNSLVQQ